MTRLERYMKGTSEPSHLEDIELIREGLGKLVGGVSDSELEALYSKWSDDYYAASWLIVERDTIKEFGEYLGSEVDE